MSFDSLHFEALIRHSVRNGTKGKREAYGLSSLSKLDDLLGERWYMRGLNSAGDFCYIEPGTVKFYLKCQHQKFDFQLQNDGSMKTQYFGNRHHLVFQFVRSDGTLAQWNSVFRSCNIRMYVTLCIVLYNPISYIFTTGHVFLLWPIVLQVEHLCVCLIL